MLPNSSHPGSDRARVVRIAARLNVGGVARHVVWVTRGLQRAGYDSVLVTGVVPPGEDDMNYFARAQGVEPLVIPAMSRAVSLKDLVTVWKLYRLFVRLRPGIVHTHTAKAGAVGRIAGLLYRWLTPGALVGRPRPLRVVHTYHGHIFHSYYGALKTRLFRWIERVLARVATDRIVVLSPQQYREIHQTFGVGRAGQFAVIPLGLDLEMFTGGAARREVVRSELGAEDADILVGIVGRLTEIKNHQLFLQAARLFKERFGGRSRRRVRFAVIGDGHLRQKLEEQAHQLGLGGDLRFAGTRQDPQDFYPALDIVALTSRNEGTPLTLIEAMANGRPGIATDVGGVVDLLGPARTPCDGPDGGYTLRERGVLVRPDDADAFCAGLARLVGDEGLRRELGKRGRLFVERNYSKERLFSDLSALYDGLLTRDAARPACPADLAWSAEQETLPDAA